jgi:hypothetical protein
MGDASLCEIIVLNCCCFGWGVLETAFETSIHSTG